MSGSPRLQVVGEQAQEEGAASGAAGTRTARGGGLLLWIVAGLLVLSVAGFLTQVARNTELEERVRAMDAELAASRAAQQAQREHLDRIRDAVAELETLVRQDPLAPVDDRR